MWNQGLKFTFSSIAWETWETFIGWPYILYFTTKRKQHSKKKTHADHISIADSDYSLDRLR